MAARLVRILIVLASVVVPSAQIRAGIMTARGRETLEALELRARQNALVYTAWNRIADARLRLLASTGDLAKLRRARNAVGQSIQASAAESKATVLAIL